MCPDFAASDYHPYLMHWTEPATADDYLLNGNLSVQRQRRRPEPALEWVMERQSVTTDKDSGITNDANLWATETMGNAKYPQELFLRVVTVSLETIETVDGLPGLDIAENRP